MARKSTFNAPVRQIVQTSEDQHKYDTPTFRRLQINAQPTNTYVTPNYVDQAGTLSTALAESMPTLALTAALFSEHANKGEEAAGASARLQETGIDPETTDKLKWYSSSDFKKGYWGTYGLEKAQVAKEQLQADWDSDPNRNSVSTAEWTNNWFKKQSAGMNDYALTSFTKELAPSLLKLSNQGALEKVEDISASVYKQRYGVLTNDWVAGNWSPEQAKKRQEELGMSNTDFDNLQVKVLEQFAQAGENPGAAQLALKVMKENRPDGTPGIAFKSNIVKSGWVEAMGTKIDQIAIAKTNAEEQVDSTGRTENQKKIIGDAEKLSVNGNIAGALKTLKQAYNNGEISFKTLSRKSAEIQQTAHSMKIGDGTGGSKMVEKDFNLTYADALEGKLSTEKITEMLRGQKISKSQADQLLQAEGRSASSENALYRVPEYKQASAIIDGFGSGKGITDEETSNIRMRASIAKTELALWASNNPDKKDQFIDKAKSIVTTEKKFLNDGGALTQEQILQKNYYPKYANPQAAYDAIVVKKTETDPYVLANEQRYWAWRATNPQAQPRKQ